MKNITFLLMLFSCIGFAQVTVMDFETTLANAPLGNAGGSLTVVNNPFSNADNNSAKVAKIVKGGSGAQVWGSGGVELSAQLPLSSNGNLTYNRISMKVYVPKAGIGVEFEAQNGPDWQKRFISSTTVAEANKWVTITFDISVDNTSLSGALNGYIPYTKLFFVFDKTSSGDQSANSTYYVDDIRLLAQGNVVQQANLPVTFEQTNVDFRMNSFGTVTASLDVDPVNSSNKVGKLVQTASSDAWGGTLFGMDGFGKKIPFTATEKIMTVDVYSPAVGIPVLLKVERSFGSEASQVQVNTTKANEWETLSFDFSTATGDKVLNLNLDYDKLAIFFNAGVKPSAQETYYFDNAQMKDQIASVGDNVFIETSIYPNPSRNQWTIKTTNASIKSLSMFNILGRQVYSARNINNTSEVIPANQFASGVYLLKVQTDLGVKTVKLIRE